LAGRRLRPYYGNGLDGKVLRRWCGIANSNGNAYCNCDSYSHAHSNSYSSSYSHAYGHTNTDAYANGCCNRYSYSNSDRNAHVDGNINPVYGEVFTDTEAAANSGAAPVVAGRADLSAVVPRMRDEGG
jgi:hypothetical protein